MSEGHDGSRGFSKRFRNGGSESVVVQENGIEILLEKLRRDLTFEIIEPKVDEFNSRPLKDNRRERSYETVVAGIELIH